MASNQELTQKWWHTRPRDFELYVSAVVLGEAERGDAALAAARVAIARELSLAQVTREALDLAAALVAGAGVPRKANEDALHISTAAVNGLDFLLTWNCTHIANHDPVSTPFVGVRASSHR